MTNRVTYVIDYDRSGQPYISRKEQTDTIVHNSFICSCDDYQVALVLCKLLNDHQTVIT